MKKKLLAVLLFTAAVLFLPKNTFAKTLEITYPSNYLTYQQLAQTYTIRESTFYEIGSTSSGLPSTMANYATGEDIFGIEYSDDKIRFTSLPGVTDSDLTSAITQEMRNNSINYNGVDVFAVYDTIKYSLKELPAVDKTDVTIDFTQVKESWDMNAYDGFVLSALQRQNLQETNSPFIVSTSLAGVNGDTENYDEILNRDGKSLVKKFYETSATPFQIKIQDGVTYKDNLTYTLDDSVKQALANEGLNINKITLIFGHEPVNTNPVNIIKNAIKNPLTMNNIVIIIALLSICTIGGISILKKKNN